MSDGYAFEDEIRGFLNSIGFENVPKWGAKRKVFFLNGQEIDAFGRCGNIYLVISAKTKESLSKRGKGVEKILNEINGYKEGVISDIKKKFEKKYGYLHTIFVLWTKDVDVSKHLKKSKKLSIALRDDYDLKYYKKAHEIIENKEVILNAFLKDLSLQINYDIFTKLPPIHTDAIRIIHGNKKMYIFGLDVENLLKFSYVFRVDTNNILSSYQRLLKDKKIKKIKNYLMSGGYFPNNIIAATDEKIDFDKDDEKDTILSGKISIPNKPCSIEVLDGQHRIYGYSKIDKKKKDCLFVTLIDNLKSDEKAKLFVTINKEQTKVPSSLLWDLYEITHPRSQRARVSKFVKKLNDNGIFKDLILLPRKRCSTAYLSFPNFCIVLDSRTKLYEDFSRDEKLLSALFEAFFSKIKNNEKLKKDWELSVSSKGGKGFLCTNNSISIMIRLLYFTLKGHKKPKINKIENWKRDLDGRVIKRLVRYLEKHEGEDKEDPYKELRSETTSEGKRLKVAKEIFGKK